MYREHRSPAGRPDADGPRLLLRVDLGTGRLTLTGELDRSTAHLLRDAIAAIVSIGGEAGVAVDVAGLVTCDAAGLRAISVSYRRLLRRGRRMTLHNASPALQLSLTRLRLDHHLLDRPPGRPADADAATA